MAATVPEGAAQGILGFIKAKKGANDANGNPIDDSNFDTGNYWHLKAAPLGTQMTEALVTAQPAISLAEGNIPVRAGELASVLTFFNNNKNTSNFTTSDSWKQKPETTSKNFGGKKRHAKTAHKRKQGRTRRVRKAKK
jgi:hypothetical protein